MADETQLSLLKQGVAVWNQFRSKRYLYQPDLREANLRGADLSEANLSGANLTGANLSFANLSRAKLSRANLSRVDLSGAKLSGADLNRANLIAANLSRADLSDADLRRGDLRSANLFSVVLNRTKLKSSTFGDTSLGTVDLSICHGLDFVQHEGPSSLGVDTIIISRGRIPKIFLRGVGVPDEWITYIPSLIWDGIQFFSCFISYSSLDKAFAIRLHDALQSEGIRCWLDEKQLLPGDDISRELERGIHSWDKFLLCASKTSLMSWWVEDEIKTTIAKEHALRRERGKPVRKLIPLNLDGYMFTDEWDLGVLATEIRSRVAADFRGWEKSDSYFTQQVDRVIRALRADEGAREPPPPSRL